MAVFTAWDGPGDIFGEALTFSYRDLPGWVNQIIGGYTLEGDLTWESGLPFTPYYSLCSEDQDITGLGGTMRRPSFATAGAKFPVGAGPFNPVTHRVNYFTPVPTLAQAGAVEGPFVRPAPGTFGNIGRDAFWGPALVNTNLVLTKTFVLKEDAHLQFTAQAYNLFNHPNLGQPNGRIDGGSSSGLITDIVVSQEGTSMRRLQFAARIQF